MINNFKSHDKVNIKYTSTTVMAPCQPSWHCNSPGQICVYTETDIIEKFTFVSMNKVKHWGSTVPVLGYLHKHHSINSLSPSNAGSFGQKDFPKLAFNLILGSQNTGHWIASEIIGGIDVQYACMLNHCTMDTFKKMNNFTFYFQNDTW